MFNKFFSSVAYELKLLLAQQSLVLLAMVCRYQNIFYYLSSCRFMQKGHCKLHIYSKMGELCHNQLSCKNNEESLLF